MRARIPASSCLFALNREISVCVRLRGGAERTRTACQPRSRCRTGLRPVANRLVCNPALEFQHFGSCRHCPHRCPMGRRIHRRFWRRKRCMVGRSPPQNVWRPLYSKQKCDVGTPSAKVVWSHRTDQTCDMALLSPVEKGRIWRVQIVWPNGKVNYVGNFTSEKDAIAWIDAHAWLTKPEHTMD
jgi:hypothetical protein